MLRRRFSHTMREITMREARSSFRAPTRDPNGTIRQVFLALSCLELGQVDQSEQVRW